MHETSLAGGQPAEQPPGNTTGAVLPAEARDTARTSRTVRSARPVPWIGLVALAYTVAQLVLVVPGLGLGWDETVYVSQVSPHVPSAFFSAPRARGVTYLVAPVTALTGSTTVLHCYLAVLSGGALHLGLRVWRPLLPVPVLALAGTLFACLWITLYYGPQVMPNLPVAFCALIATGCFLRVVGAGHGRGGVGRTPRGALIGMGVAVAVAALMRPTDAVWLVLPLALAALFVRPWRRPAVLLVLAAGAVLGAAEWITEAYASYGGLSARLDRAAEIQGGMGGHLGFGHQLRALEGRSLCRPCGGVRWREPWTAVWWFALPLLTAGGVLAGARAGLRAVVVVPTLTGLSLAVQYLLMIDYAAPRFLLPTYVLLLLPVALCLTRLVGAAAPARRSWAAGAVALVLAVHIGSQYAILGGLISRSRDSREAMGRTAAELNRLGVRPPCTVNGADAVRIGFRAGCGSRQAAGHDGSISRAGLTELAEREPVAVLVPLGRPAPAYARGWRSRPFPRQPGLAGFRAYLSPAARP